MSLNQMRYRKYESTLFNDPEMVLCMEDGCDLPAVLTDSTGCMSTTICYDIPMTLARYTPVILQNEANRITLDAGVTTNLPHFLPQHMLGRAIEC